MKEKNIIFRKINNKIIKQIRNKYLIIATSDLYNSEINIAIIVIAEEIIANYISKISGGSGVVRDVIHHLLVKENLWSQVLTQAYGVGV